MKRTLVLLYGSLCYLIFFATFLYAIWFVWTMDEAQVAAGSVVQALLVNAVLLSIFALQHSIMARSWFKRAWTRVIAPPIERSTFVLAASLALLAVVVLWQPMPELVWQVENVTAILVLQVLFWIGWGIVLATTFLIDHFDLFGLKQVWFYFTNRPYSHLTFRTPGPYNYTRHPLYLGFIIAFWSAPTMTQGHLFFSIVTTAYILVAIQFEEHDLVTYFGDQHRTYRREVSMLIPWKRRAVEAHNPRRSGAA